MASIVQRVTDTTDEVRERRPLVDHVVRTVQHYGTVKGSLQAGAVTYFAFLSFFPVLALAFATVGLLAAVYPGARGDLRQALDQVLPGLIGTKEGQVPLSAIEQAAAGALGVGIVFVLYSGLGWLSAMRAALREVFEEPQDERPNLVVGKLRDLAGLVTLGSVLLVSVALSGVVTSLAEPILRFLGLGVAAEPVVWVLATALGLAASTVMFFAFFRILGDSDEPRRSLWEGALLGAVLFELLKQVSRYLLASTAEQPAFQAFGIALVVLVWINYFSRVVMVAASWAFTSPTSREKRRAEEWQAARDATVPEGPGAGPMLLAHPDQVTAPPTRASRPRPPVVLLGAGAAFGALLGWLLGRPGGGR